MWPAQNGMADPDNAGAGAYSYMELMGLVILGWMWLKMVQVSGPLAANGLGERDFHEAKLVTGRFYAEREPGQGPGSAGRWKPVRNRS